MHVESLVEAVLLRLARRDVVTAHAAVVGPGQDGIGRMLRAVVTDDRVRPSPLTTMASSSRATSRPDRDVPATRRVILGCSCRSPLGCGSAVHRSSHPTRSRATSGISNRRRVPIARLRPPRRLTSLLVDRMPLAPKHHLRPAVAEPSRPTFASTWRPRLQPSSCRASDTSMRHHANYPCQRLATSGHTSCKGPPQVCWPSCSRRIPMICFLGAGIASLCPSFGGGDSINHGGL